MAMMASPNPFSTAKNAEPTKSADEMNAALLRIAGIRSDFVKKSLGVAESVGTPRGAENSAQINWKPEADEPAQRPARPARREAVEAPGNWNSNRGPDSSSFSRDLPAKKLAGKIYKSPEQDSDPEDVDVLDATESKRVRKGTTKMESLIGISRQEFNRLRGPLMEGTSGQVPTSGATSDHNNLPGGSAGLEGTPMVNLRPERYGDDGEESEMTFDDAVSMLKKEGIDLRDLWTQFLEERGLSERVFYTLVNEAYHKEDMEQIDTLLRVEDIFFENYLNELFWKKKPEPNMEPLKQAASLIRQHGIEAVKSASRMGRQVGTPGAPSGQIKPGSTFVPRKSMAAGTLKKGSGGWDEGSDSMALEADDDGEGNPQMPWVKNGGKMKKFAKKWGRDKAAC